MKFSEIELPSNRKFGFFLVFVFASVGVYCHYISNAAEYAIIFGVGASIFLLVTLLKSDVLRPLNKLWMHFGVLLGTIVAPMVLGIIFFGLFTPTALVARFGKRDELRLTLIQKSSYWISRSELIKSESFKHQF